MENRSKYLIKNTSILTISNFSSKLLAFLLVPLYTNVLTTEEYGTYDLIMSTMQLIIPFLTFNIADSVFRFLIDRKESLKQVKSIGFKQILYSIVGMGVLFISNHFVRFWQLINGLEIFIFLYFSFYILNQLLIQTARGQEQVKELGVSGIASTIVSLACNILFLLLIPLGLKGFFLAYTLGQVISVVYLCYVTRFFGGISFEIDLKLRKRMLAYSVPLILSTLGWLINNVSDRYIVTWLCGISVNGIYSVSYKIPTIITVVQNIFMQAWAISAVKEYENEDRDDFYRRIFMYLNCLMAVCCSFLIFASKMIARILYAKDFYIAWKYAPFLLISVVFGASSGYIGAILGAKMDSGSVAKSTLIGAVINMILNAILIYHMGPQGAAIATAVSNMIIYWYRKKSIGSIFCDINYSRIMISWVVLIIQATMMILNFPLLCQIPFVIALMLIYKETLMKIIKRM